MLKGHRPNGKVQWERTFEGGILSVASMGGGKESHLWVHTRAGIVHIIPSGADCHAREVGATERVNCGQFTFCRMNHFRYHGKGSPLNLVALPSQATPDAIDVWDADRSIIIVAAVQPTSTPMSSSIGAAAVSSDKCGLVMCAKLVAVPTIKGYGCDDDDKLVLLTGTDDGVLRAYLLDLEAGTHQQILRLKIFPQTVTCLDYSFETHSVALGGPRTDLVLIRNLFDDEQRLTVRTCVANEGFSELCFSPSGRLLVTGGWDGKYAPPGPIHQHLIYSVESVSLLHIPWLSLA